VTSPSTRTVASVALLTAIVGALVVSLRSGDDGVVRGEDVLQHPVAPPFVMFRTLGRDDTHGRIAVLGLRPGATRELTRLSCTRVHYAAGRGLCITHETQDRRVLHVASLFDATLEPGRRIMLDGVPIRVRVAPNGRVGAITTYLEEEGAGGERLATRSRLVDMRSGQPLADLREFRIEHRGLPPLDGPVDVSSVAFERDGDRFFATLATDSERYLAAGSVTERRLTVIRKGVANEALSPDGRRLAVKRLLADRGFWQLAVIELSTWAEQDLLQGTRSVDDQVEWLDDRHVMYHDVDGDTTALWMLPIDGVNGPSVLVKDAYSGVVQP
jgi:hypothetical protein